MNGDNDIFIRVTNKDIAAKIDKVYDIVQEFKDENGKAHNEIIVHQKETNGKVKMNELKIKIFMGLTTSVIVTIIGLLIKDIVGG